MELATPLETICRLIIRSRENEAQVPAVNENDDPSPPDDADDAYDVLEDETNDSVEEEIRTTLEDLADDQLAEVLALAWVGRGTYDASEWDEAIEAANDPDAEDPIEQIMDMPMLAGYLDSALAAFDLSCDGIGQID